LLHLPDLLLLVLLLGAASACAAPEPGPVSVQITLEPQAGATTPTRVEVSGLFDADVETLRDRTPASPDWSPLLRVLVDEAGEWPAGEPPAVLGRYAVTDSALIFTPQFPFDPGRAYRVVFDPSHLPRPRKAPPITAVVRLPAVIAEPARVVAVHPSAGVVPENLLRVYIEFSAPMGNGVGVDFVKLVDLSGQDGAAERVEPGAFLPVEANFWSPDHTRYTLFFDPGRVKDDILPNRASGRPLRAGRKYAIDVSAAWTDAHGQPLEAGHRHTFTVGPAVDKPIAIADWKLELPAAETRNPLTVRFPRPLDHGILVRALSVETADQRRIDGIVALDTHDVGWTFIPATAWTAGTYNLVAQGFLEDPQGNQIGRAFETSTDLPDSPRASGADEVDAPSRLPFTIGSTR
jgi:hypothetical protein